MALLRALVCGAALAIALTPLALVAVSMTSAAVFAENSAAPSPTTDGGQWTAYGFNITALASKVAKSCWAPAGYAYALMNLELTGKTAIVTGGSRGIGKAIARELAGEGVDVAIVARSIGPLEAAAAELAEATGRRILPILADTGSDASVKAMVEQAASGLGRVDILVNCAAQPGGQQPPPKLANITDDAFYSDVNVKVMGYLRCARECAPHMIRQGWGRIINVSGLAARSTGSTIGSIRNVAVVALSKNLADELGPHGINVTVVHPSLTRTEKTADVIAARAERQGISFEEAEKRMVNNLVGHWIDARDIAYVVTFLASPKAVAINGDVIAAGGGIPGSIHY